MNTDLRKAADIAINTCMGVKKTETVLIVCDEPCREIGYELFNSAKNSSFETVLCEIEPRNSNGEEPPEQVSELLKSFDVALIPTSRSLSHTDARREASKNGVRIATLPGITTDSMVRTLSADYNKIAVLSRKVAEILTIGKSVNIKTDKGTGITLNIEGRSGLPDTGLNHSRGNFSNLPAGEAYIAPMENISAGNIVFDGSMAGIGILNDENIIVRVKDGLAWGFDGGECAKRLHSIMEPFGEAAFNVAELGIGTNDKAVISGNVLEDEKVLGTIHIAFGDNKSMGGTVGVASHLDGVITAPTITVDGKIIMEKGVLRIDS